jgi:hypothetical protein
MKFKEHEIVKIESIDETGTIININGNYYTIELKDEIIIDAHESDLMPARV